MGRRLRADGAEVGLVSVGIRYADMSYVSHQKVLAVPTNLTWEIYGAGCRLFRELWNGRPLRHMGVHTGRVRGESFVRQMSIFDEIDYEKLMGVDKTVDGIRRRFGADAVMRAVFLDNSISHMSGGIENVMKPH